MSVAPNIDAMARIGSDREAALGHNSRIFLNTMLAAARQLPQSFADV